MPQPIYEIGTGQKKVWTMILQHNYQQFNQRLSKAIEFLRYIIGCRKSKFHHLTLDYGLTSMCGFEHTYQGQGPIDLVDPTALSTLVNGRPKGLGIGGARHKGVCAKCWYELMVFITYRADEAALDAIYDWRVENDLPEIFSGTDTGETEDGK